MTHFSRYIFLSLLMLVISAAAFAQADINKTEATNTPVAPLVSKNDTALKYANTITPEDLLEHLTIIASDEYEGRATGQKGQKLAAEYIKNYFQKLGLPPVVNDTSYYQQFPLMETSWGKNQIVINDNEYKFLKDFYTFFNMSTTANIKTDQVIFAGYGIETDEYNDYKKADITDKVTVILAGEPMDDDGISYITGTNSRSEWSTNWKMKISTAAKYHPNTLLIVVSNMDKHIQIFNYYVSGPELQPDDNEQQASSLSFPVIFISTEMGNALLEKNKYTIETYQEKLNSKFKPKALKATSAIQITTEKNREKVTGENVLGFIEGSDLKDEIVVITAHYDHEGIKGGEIYNGADDDGSGTVALLEIAEAFNKAKHEGYGPRRSILIMAVDGEEKGLLGSEYYSDHPVFPLENTVVNLNSDMIGRIDNDHQDDSNYIYIIGSNMLSSELHELNEAVNDTYTGLTLDYKFNSLNDPNKFYYRSDHYNFAKHGIPIIFYFNGAHEDYHKPTDTIEKINFNLLTKRAQLIFLTAWEIANREHRLKVDQ